MEEYSATVSEPVLAKGALAATLLATAGAEVLRADKKTDKMRRKINKQEKKVINRIDRLVSELDKLEDAYDDGAASSARGCGGASARGCGD